MMAASSPPAGEVPAVDHTASDEQSAKIEDKQSSEIDSVPATADDPKAETEQSEPALDVSATSVPAEVELEQTEKDKEGKIGFEDLQTAVEEIDENLDEAFGHAADTFWNFATSVTGKVSSVVKDQSGLETLRKNVTSQLPPLTDISRDIQTKIGTLRPNEKSIASLAGSVKSVAETVQRNAVAMEEAILAKANEVGDEKTGTTALDESNELTVDDPSIGLLPDIRGSSGLDEIAKVGESVSNALGQTVGGLWSGLWGAEYDEEEIERRKAKMPKTRFGKRIFELQANPDTYCEPAEDLDGFEKWSIDFNLNNYDDECIEILYTHDSIAELYERVVPRVVDENMFWMRYFFAKYNLEMEEERRQKLLERAENAVEVGDDDEDGWGDDDWGEESPDEKDGDAPVNERPDEGPSQLQDKVEESIASATSDIPALRLEDQTQKDSNKDIYDSGEEKEKREDTQKHKNTDNRPQNDKPVAQVKVQDADDDWGDDDWE